MSTEPIQEAEVIEGSQPQPLQVVPQQPISLTDAPGAAILPVAQEMATALADMIRKQGLAVNLQGREHVTVEGWTTLAAMVGLAPTEISNEKQDDGSYLASVALIDTSTGMEVGRASAECGEGESRWMKMPAYARRSMAATRATSKVCRVRLSWIMKLAGYEATPAEEMDFNASSSGSERPTNGGGGRQELSGSGASAPSSSPPSSEGLSERALNALDLMTANRERIELAQRAIFPAQKDYDFAMQMLDRYANYGPDTKMTDKQTQYLKAVYEMYEDWVSRETRQGTSGEQGHARAAEEAGPPAGHPAAMEGDEDDLPF